VTVAGADPAKPSNTPIWADRGNLALRVASSAVLAPLAIAAAYFGGTLFVLFWMAAALCVIWEWDTLVSAHEKNPVLTIGAVAIAGAGVLLMLGRTITVFALIALGMMGVATLASRSLRVWCVAGVAYAGVLLVCPVLIRRDAALGFQALLFLFVVVWLTDVLAYFAGRALGGPKLMPAVSPKKTWSGALGGAVGGTLGGLSVGMYLGFPRLSVVALIAFLLSTASQAGDLLESWIKRRFDAKDASSLIPGHGGVMDRLDGFVVAALLAMLIGGVRGGIENPARGLLIW
jgi:phosphatidate cytidylyltransferase